MDPLTHYMWAYILGKKFNLGKPQLKALTFSAFLPDIDVFTIIFGLDFVVNFHGTITHSIGVSVLLSIIFSIVFFIYYKKVFIHYFMIGITMHLLLDLSMTLMPKWRDEGMILLFPFSIEKFALRNHLPYSTFIGVLLMGFLFITAVYFLYYYIKNEEYPWRIWINEQKILRKIRNK